MVEAYMDESGIHDGAHVCVIAGYWGSEKKWKQFEPWWSQIIKDAKEPSLKEFHSAEFWYADGKRKGVFSRWSDAKADKFIDDLVRCIIETKVFPTSAALVVDEWEKLNKAERMLLTGGYYHLARQRWVTMGAPNKFYFFPFAVALASPAVHCKPGLHMHYTFDLNKQFKNHAVNLYALLKNDRTLECRHRLGPLVLATGEEPVGLQAADLFAYQTYKFGRERIRSGRPVPIENVPALLQKLLTNLQSVDDCPFLDRDGMNMALNKLPLHMRSPGWPSVVIRPRR